MPKSVNKEKKRRPKGAAAATPASAGKSKGRILHGFLNLSLEQVCSFLILANDLVGLDEDEFDDAASDVTHLSLDDDGASSVCCNYFLFKINYSKSVVYF